MTPLVTVRLTRISPTHHRFDYVRPDGTGEAIEMETRSALFHDLLHFAVESEAGLRGSFYGLLAKVGGYEELIVAGGEALGGEAAITERIVGALTGALKGGQIDPEAFQTRMAEYLELYDEKAPRWLTPAFVLAVKERMRQLEGRWKATPFGQTMELAFPPSP
ncbi:MAG: hypothetical protein ACHP7N_03605 [Caulobacterales bacterium]